MSDDGLDKIIAWLDCKVGMRVREIRKSKSMMLSTLSRKVGLRPEDLVMFERGDLKLSMGHVFAISIALEEPLTGFLPNLLDVDALEDCGNLITLRRHVREAVATTDDTTSLKRALQELKSGHAGTGFFLERSAEAVHNLD